MSYLDLAEASYDVAIPRRRFARRRLVTARQGTPVKVDFSSGGALVGTLAYVTSDEVAVEMAGGLCVVGTSHVATISPLD